jgi:hypothetical protein
MEQAPSSGAHGPSATIGSAGKAQESDRVLVNVLSKSPNMLDESKPNDSATVGVPSSAIMTVGVPSRAELEITDRRACDNCVPGSTSLEYGLQDPANYPL